jgi:hypothetical protein
VVDVLSIIATPGFDVLGAILNSFLVPPVPGSHNYTAALDRYERFRYIWNSIQSEEACNNLGLRGLGTTPSYDNDPSGPLGALNILSPLAIPIKLALLVRGKGGKKGNRRIHGIPENFDMDPASVMFRQYRTYKNDYLDSCKSYLFKLREECVKFQKKRGSKKKDKESDDESDNESSEVCLPCVGGWPCELVSFSWGVCVGGELLFDIVCVCGRTREPHM